MNTADQPAVVTADPPPSQTAIRTADGAHRDRRFALLATIGFALAVGILIWRHAPWRDELQAWAIVRDNPNPFDLLAQLRYEGHPALWYAVLWLPARLTRSVAALQFVQWALAVGGAAVVARYAPFSRLARVLLLTSYFPLFEYGVIARSYTLVWLITVSVLALLPRRFGLIALAGGAALLTNTTVLAIPLALALTVGVLVDRAVQPPGTTRAARLGAPMAYGLYPVHWFTFADLVRLNYLYESRAIFPLVLFIGASVAARLMSGMSARRPAAIISRALSARRKSRATSCTILISFGSSTSDR
jgi:hypothetical protein